VKSPDKPALTGKPYENISSLKPYQDPRNVLEEKASSILSNLTYSKSLKKALILLLVSIEKSKKWALTEEKQS
jgi:hypothetical protein